jgi:PAS domain S-box-containing protein
MMYSRWHSEDELDTTMRRATKKSKSAPGPKKNATASPLSPKDERRTKAELIEELHQLRKLTKRPARPGAGGPGSEEEFHAVVRNAPLVFFGIDADGMFTLSEGKGLDALGLKPGEVVGQSVFELYRDVPEITKKLKVALKGKEVKYIVNVEDLWFETILSPMRDRQGTVREILGIAIDITERKRAQDTLELSRFALDNAGDAIFLTARDGRFHYVNEAACKALGYSGSELLALSIFDIDPDYPKERWPSHWSELRETEKLTFETRHKRKDERIIPVEVTTRLFHWGGTEYNLGFARDISERKKAEERLRESEERLQKIAEATFEGIGITEGGIVIDTNARMAAMLGYERDGMLGRNVMEFVAPESREQVEGMMREGFPDAYEHRALRNDGAVITVEVRGKQSVYKGKNVRITAIRDITERKNYENDLVESEERYRSLFTNEIDAISIFDIQTREIIDVNEAFLNLYGYSRDEALRLTTDDISAEPEVTRRAIRESADAGNVMIPERLHRKKDGTECYVEISAGPFKWKGRKLMYAIARDITGRKETEQSLRESEARFRELADLLPQPVCEANVKGEFTYANVKGLETFGYTRDDLHHGMTFLQIFAPEEERRVEENFRKVLRGEEFDVHEYRMVRRDGSTFPAVLYAAPIIRGDEPVGVRVALTDITDLRRLESQLLHAQKMEAIGTLTAGVAHEFNNILTSILGFGEFLQDALDEDSAVKKYADMIVHSAERAAKLTAGMLAYTRKQTTDFEAMDLNTMLDSVEDFLSDLVGDNITLRMLKSDGELPVRGDKSQLEQVVLNLTTNAIDAMPDGGTLTIESGRKEIAPSSFHHRASIEPGTYAFVSVTDTGTGMDAGTREKIFEPFYTTKEVGKGTGLGLSVVYGIVERHEGTIHVVSKPGRGTSFEVNIPLGRAVAAEEQEKGLPPTRGYETVLVAEDDESVRTLIRLTLESAGYRVIEAVDGEDAVSTFTRHQDQIDFLLFDVAMPRKDGLTACREIRKLNNGIKAAFLTGNIAVPGLEEEGHACIFKPITPKELLSTIRRVVES